MQRTARCSCGTIQVTVEGEPTGGIVACHCQACQRRTGSTFGVGAYFPRDRVSVTGTPRSFVRPTDAGHRFHTCFCATCGSSTHWHSDRSPDLIGVALGAFDAPWAWAPVRSVWEASMHHWVHVPCAEQHFLKGRTA